MFVVGVQNGIGNGVGVGSCSVVFFIIVYDVCFELVEVVVVVPAVVFHCSICRSPFNDIILLLHFIIVLVLVDLVLVILLVIVIVLVVVIVIILFGIAGFVAFRVTTCLCRRVLVRGSVLDISDGAGGVGAGGGVGAVGSVLGSVCSAVGCVVLLIVV